MEWLKPCVQQFEDCLSSSESWGELANPLDKSVDILRAVHCLSLSFPALKVLNSALYQNVARIFENTIGVINNIVQLNAKGKANSIHEESKNSPRSPEDVPEAKTGEDCSYVDFCDLEPDWSIERNIVHHLSVITDVFSKIHEILASFKSVLVDDETLFCSMKFSEESLILRQVASTLESGALTTPTIENSFLSAFFTALDRPFKISVNALQLLFTLPAIECAEFETLLMLCKTAVQIFVCATAILSDLTKFFLKDSSLGSGLYHCVQALHERCSELFPRKATDVTCNTRETCVSTSQDSSKSMCYVPIANVSNTKENGILSPGSIKSKCCDQEPQKKVYYGPGLPPAYNTKENGIATSQESVKNVFPCQAPLKKVYYGPTLPPVCNEENEVLASQEVITDVFGFRKSSTNACAGPIFPILRDTRSDDGDNAARIQSVSVPFSLFQNTSATSKEIPAMTVFSFEGKSATETDNPTNPLSNGSEIRFPGLTDVELKLLTSEQRKTLEGLIAKCDYHVNFLSFSVKSAKSEVQVLCKICDKVLRVESMQEHLNDAAHQRNLFDKFRAKKRAREGKSTGSGINPVLNTGSTTSVFVEIGDIKLDNVVPDQRKVLLKSLKEIEWHVKLFLFAVKPAELEVRPAELEVQTAELEVRPAELEVETENLEPQAVDADLEIAESVSSAAESELETAKSDLETAKSDLETAKSDLETAKSDLKTAEVELQVECKICNKTLLAEHVEVHIDDLSHHRSIYEKCKASSETREVIGQIHADNWQFLKIVSDAEYRCSLCSVTFGGFTNTWSQHFHSIVHRTNLKERKSQPAEHTDPAASAHFFRDSLEANFEYLEISQKLRVGTLLAELKEEVNFFSIEKKRDSTKFSFFCHLCKTSVSSKKVPDHVKCREHLRRLTREGWKVLNESVAKDKNSSREDSKSSYLDIFNEYYFKDSCGTVKVKSSSRKAKKCSRRSRNPANKRDILCRGDLELQEHSLSSQEESAKSPCFKSFSIQRRKFGCLPKHVCFDDSDSSSSHSEVQTDRHLKNSDRKMPVRANKRKTANLEGCSSIRAKVAPYLKPSSSPLPTFQDVAPKVSNSCVQNIAQYNLQNLAEDTLQNQPSSALPSPIPVVIHSYAGSTAQYTLQNRVQDTAENRPSSTLPSVIPETINSCVQSVAHSHLQNHAQDTAQNQPSSASPALIPEAINSFTQSSTQCTLQNLVEDTLQNHPSSALPSPIPVVINSCVRSSAQNHPSGTLASFIPETINSCVQNIAHSHLQNHAQDTAQTQPPSASSALISEAINTCAESTAQCTLQNLVQAAQNHPSSTLHSLIPEAIITFARNRAQCTLQNPVQNNAQKLPSSALPAPTSEVANAERDSFRRIFDSLSPVNKQIVRNIAARLRDKMIYFALSNKPGTRELRIVCKVCRAPMRPEKVESHISDLGHLKRLAHQIGDFCAKKVE